MSSKFRELLAQARNRSNDDETDEDSEAAQDQKEEVAVEETPSPAIQEKPSFMEQETTPEATPAATPEPASVEPEPTQSAVFDTSLPKRGRPRNGKRSDPSFTQITAYISKKTHQNVKVALLGEGEGRELSELVEECLLSWLEQRQ